MTITIRLPEALEAELRVKLETHGMALSAFVRAAIAEKLEREAEQGPFPYAGDLHLFGRHDSGRDDLSTDRKAIVREKLRAKHHR